MTIEGRLQFALVLLLFNRHSKNIGGALQESDVMLAKFAFGSAVHFEHAEWRAVALQDDIHRTADAVLDKQFRSSEAFLVFEMI